MNVPSQLRAPEFREPSTVDTAEMRKITEQDLPELARIFVRDQFHVLWEIDMEPVSEWLADNVPVYRDADTESDQAFDIYDQFMAEVTKVVGSAVGKVEV